MPITLLAVALISAGRADAAENPDWQVIADTIFRPVGQTTDAPAVVLPTAIAQDQAGFLWAGSEAGLARWDGYRFRLYPSEGMQPDGLPDHNILTLSRDAAGRLLVGTVTGGLARYDLASDHFQPLPLPTSTGPAACVWSISGDGDGGIWVATSTGLFHLDSHGQVVRLFRHDAAQPGSLPQDKIQAVLRDRNGVVWVGGAFGLAHGTDGNTHFVLMNLPVLAGAQPEVSHLLEDRSGRLWIGSRQQGAYVISASGGAATRITDTAPPAGESTAPEITAMAEIGPNVIWLGTFGQGLVEVDPATRHTRRIRHNPFVPASLERDTVTALYTDRSGLAWVGTPQGLSLHDPGNRGVLTLWGDPGRKDGLRVSEASAILARPDGRLWVGSEGNGLQILDPSGQPSVMLAIDRVFSLAATETGAVYVGSRNGLFVADRDGKSLRRIDVPHRQPDAAVNALLALGDTLWLGGGDDGLWELRPGAGGAVTVARHLDQPVLTNGTLRTIALAPDGLLAVGTDRGFNLLNRASGAVERIVADQTDPQGLSPGAVMSFATDRSGRLWVGTDNSGINVLTGRDAAGRPRFRHLGKTEGLPNGDISRMLVDRQGMIWASTDSGLAMIDPDSFTVRALQTPDGVVVPTYWSNSGDITPDGDLVFGGIGGISIVRPTQVRPWTYRPPVVVTSIKAGGRTLPGADAGPAPGGWVNIKPKANSLAVDFSALDFSAPDLNRYAYWLEGFDQDWIETDAADRMAFYTNLPPGDYTLHLRGSNRRGIWTEQSTALHIRVLPAWFQSLAFRSAAALAAVLMVVGLVQARTLILKQRQRELERQVLERTKELSSTQEKLQHFAYFDALTALPNRRAFNDEFQALVNAVPAQPFALILVDLDGFKTVNDSLGHLAGDALLVAAAGRMRGAIREQEFIARLGGDEFAILVRATQDQVLVSSLCERIVTAMAEPICIRGATVTVGASAGAALFPRDGRTQDELYRHVDLALYEAKNAGRGVWRWYRDSKTVSAT
jgi:diguanylate cyclase (GGDEF)-like protein